MDMQELKNFISYHDLETYESEILQEVIEIISFIKHSEDDYTEVGKSRIGGNPDLPPTMQWPYIGETCLTFLAQINLEELQQETPSELLPRKGMLYFFIGSDEHAFDLDHKVIYLQECDHLICTTPPETPVIERTRKTHFRPYRISIEPSYDFRLKDWMYDLENGSVGDLFRDLMDNLRSDLEPAYMFGYTFSEHDDAEIRAALKLVTGKPYEYDLELAKKQIAEQLGSEEKMEKTLQDMLCLFALDSDDMIGFHWWNIGALFFFINKEDLLALNFDRTFVSLYSS